jgi:NADH pyrophosphatase NudC (nudix superfamily)
MEYRYCPLCRAELTHAVRGGETRLVCPHCAFVQWRNPVPVVAAVVERLGRVILVRSLGRPAHWYGLVAGFERVSA